MRENRWAVSAADGSRPSRALARPAAISDCEEATTYDEKAPGQ